MGWNYVVQFGSTGFKTVHKNQPYALFLFIDRFFTVKFADFKTIKIISLSIINSIIVVFSWTLNLYVLLLLKIYDQQRELDNSMKEGVISSNVLLERCKRIKKSTKQIVVVILWETFQSLICSSDLWQKFMKNICKKGHHVAYYRSDFSWDRCL